jgi:hypothetical protein
LRFAIRATGDKGKTGKEDKGQTRHIVPRVQFGSTLTVVPPTCPDKVGFTDTPPVPTAISAVNIGLVQAVTARNAARQRAFICIPFFR